MSVKIKREEFMCIVGFYANIALVDKKLLHHIKKLSPQKLLEKGHLNSAVRYAFYDATKNNNDESKKIICSFFKTDDFSALTRRFGITENILTNSESKFTIKFI